MQTLNTRPLTSQPHFYGSPRGLDGTDGLELASAPFRPINLDHIQNSSNGKHPFRSPLAHMLQKGQTSGSNNGAAKFKCPEEVAAVSVLRFNTDLKIPMRMPQASHSN
jgi:hypothetical protein